MVDLDKGLLKSLRDRKIEAGLAVIEETATEQEFDADLLLTDEDVAFKGAPELDEIDKVLASIDIIEGYNRWCDKGIVEASGRKVEGIKVHCPNPDHPDEDPSAWINTDKNLWACGGCGHRGGDIFDIAAWHFGYSVPGYKSDFHELKKKMATSLGYVTKKSPSGVKYLDRVTPAEPQDPEPAADKPKPNPQPKVEGSALDKFRKAKGFQEPVDSTETPAPAAVISLVPRIAEDPDAEEAAPSLDWRSLMEEGTFMNEWMKASKTDDLPEEYYFWLGLMGVGLAVGNILGLADNPPIKGNLFVVLYGTTGIGKSRSINSLLDVLARAFPSSSAGEGVYNVPSPGSAEALIDSFSPFDMEASPGSPPIPVKGLIRFDELSTLMGRADRAGSAMKPTLMEFYDSYNPVTHKTRGHGEVTATNHFASCVTTTQPRAIRALLTQTDADAGFVNRWIFATGTPKRPIAFGRPSIDYSKCVPLLSGINSWAQDLHDDSSAKWRKTSTGLAWTPVDMDEDALELWSEFFHAELVPNKMGEDNALLSRSDLTMKKIIALFAYDRRHAQVTLKDVQDAISVWSYLSASYNALSREIGVGVFEDCRRFIGEAIQGHILRTSQKPAAREILRLIDGKYNAGLVKSVIETMVSLGEIEEVIEESKSGKRTPRYLYIEA